VKPAALQVNKLVLRTRNEESKKRLAAIKWLLLMNMRGATLNDVDFRPEEDLRLLMQVSATLSTPQVVYTTTQLYPTLLE
jgi:hypothetical protein